MPKKKKAPTPTPDQAILAAVIAEPGVDLHRHAYADWIDDFGSDGDEERAEFIRLQLSGKSIDFNPRDAGTLPRLLGLKTPSHWLNWTTPTWSKEGNVVSATGWFGGARGKPMQIHFYRGFAVSVFCDQAAWVESGPLFAAGNPLGHVGLTDREPESLAGVVRQWNVGSKSRGLEESKIYKSIAHFLKQKIYISGDPLDPMDDLSRACILWARWVAGGMRGSRKGGVDGIPVVI